MYLLYTEPLMFQIKENIRRRRFEHEVARGESKDSPRMTRARQNRNVRTIPCLATTM